MITLRWTWCNYQLLVLVGVAKLQGIHSGTLVSFTFHNLLTM